MSKQDTAIAEAYGFFNSKKGKLVLNDLVKAAGLFELKGPLGDPQELAFREGQRSIVHQILSTSKIPTEVIFKALMDEDYNYTEEEKGN